MFTVKLRDRPAGSAWSTLLGASRLAKEHQSPSLSGGFLFCEAWGDSALAKSRDTSSSSSSSSSSSLLEAAVTMPEALSPSRSPLPVDSPSKSPLHLAAALRAEGIIAEVDLDDFLAATAAEEARADLEPAAKRMRESPKPAGKAGDVGSTNERDHRASSPLWMEVDRGLELDSQTELTRSYSKTRAGRERRPPRDWRVSDGAQDIRGGVYNEGTFDDDGDEDYDDVIGDLSLSKIKRKRKTPIRGRLSLPEDWDPEPIQPAQPVREVNTAIKARLPSGDQAKAVPDRKEAWACSLCTFVNDPLSASCDMCQQKRVVKEDPSWTCQSCTYLNSSKKKCEMCGAKYASQSQTEPEPEAEAEAEAEPEPSRRQVTVPLNSKEKEKEKEKERQDEISMNLNISKIISHFGINQAGSSSAQTDQSNRTQPLGQRVPSLSDSRASKKGSTIEEIEIVNSSGEDDEISRAYSESIEVIEETDSDFDDSFFQVPKQLEGTIESLNLTHPNLSQHYWSVKDIARTKASSINFSQFLLKDRPQDIAEYYEMRNESREKKESRKKK